ncbi:MAG TPA: hypothetical protein VNZ52_15510 [Candidatus Thermoplasmatota archaeon]|nr:hypothetical protein [Candidatus Thermoplasmatota archaeon]
MRSRLEPLGHALALLLGALAGFFLVFAGVFSDGASPGERYVSYALVVTAYGLLGLALGYAWPRRFLVWTLEASVPTLLFLAWYTTREPQQALLHFAYAALVVGGSLAGASAGARLRRARERPASNL